MLEKIKSQTGAGAGGGGAAHDKPAKSPRGVSPKPIKKQAVEEEKAAPANSFANAAAKKTDL